LPRPILAACRTKLTYVFSKRANPEVPDLPIVRDEPVAAATSRGCGEPTVKSKRTPGARRGVAAVELAILLPFLAFIFAASVDFARIFYYTQIIETCARNGALYLSDSSSALANTYTNVTNAALADAGTLTPTPTVTSGTGTDSGGTSYVTCTVSWQFNTITNFPLIPSMNLTRTSQMSKAN
jgi:Flp pilus assembly protein TadG